MRNKYLYLIIYKRKALFYILFYIFIKILIYLKCIYLFLNSRNLVFIIY
jgi:hypothetical protein